MQLIFYIRELPHVLCLFVHIIKDFTRHYQLVIHYLIQLFVSYSSFQYIYLSPKSNAIKNFVFFLTILCFLFKLKQIALWRRDPAVIQKYS